ncbi:MAG: tRNA-intron lyase [Nitrosopumilus sp.]|nr:tRNA-intron lyase [Nitrosopumilus sp.]
MEDGSRAAGRIMSGRACVLDPAAAGELEGRGYGRPEDGRLVLGDVEALYLVYAGRLEIRGSTFESLLRRCEKEDPDIFAKFLIYRDLRGHGYVVRDGFGFGRDFRVYEKGRFGEKAARYIVFGMDEGGRERIGSVHKKVVEMARMGKEPVAAVVERRGEVIYYRMSRIEFRGP